jgi:hypothetical protein
VTPGGTSCVTEQFSTGSTAYHERSPAFGHIAVSLSPTTLDGSVLSPSGPAFTPTSEIYSGSRRGKVKTPNPPLQFPGPSPSTTVPTLTELPGYLSEGYSKIWNRCWPSPFILSLLYPLNGFI